MIVFIAGVAFAAEPVKSIEPGPGRVIIYVDRDATAAQRSALEQRLRSTPGVAEVSHETPAEAYARFKQQFRDAPDVVASIHPDSLPESFIVRLADATCVEVYVAAFEDVAGVRDARGSVGLGPPPIAVAGYVVQLTSGGDRETVEQGIARVPGASAPTFETATAAADRLRHCGVVPDPAAMHPSLRFVWRPPHNGDTKNLFALDRLPGVERAFLVPVQML